MGCGQNPRYDSKIIRGTAAGVVTTDWILANYDGTKPSGGSEDPVKIRIFLIDAYQAWGTEYALLGGGKDDPVAQTLISTYINAY